MKKTMKWFFMIVSVLIGLTVIYSCATVPTTDFVPGGSLSQVEKLTPTTASQSDLPPEIMAFSNKWRGNWQSLLTTSGEGLNATIVVEEISTQRAKVLYSWESSFSWNVSPGSARYTAVFSKNEKGETILSWTTARGGKFTFKINKDGNLEGTAGNSFVVMKRLSK